MSVEPSIAQLQTIIGGMCDGACIEYHLATDHAARTDALERIIEFSYHSLMRNAHLNYKETEDQLSVTVVEQLRMLAIQASHDTQTRGHCDIHVEGRDHFLWIGEAKIHSTYQWLEDGFQQLSTRYTTGGYGQDRGELIIYCRTQHGTDVLRSWLDRLMKIFEGVEVTEDAIESRLWFRTTHKSVGTGALFHTRHRLIPLYFKPQK